MIVILQYYVFDYVEFVVIDFEVVKSFFMIVFGWSFQDYGFGYVGILLLCGDGSEVGGFFFVDEL